MQGTDTHSPCDDNGDDSHTFALQWVWVVVIVGVIVIVIVVFMQQRMSLKINVIVLHEKWEANRRKGTERGIKKTGQTAAMKAASEESQVTVWWWCRWLWLQIETRHVLLSFTKGQMHFAFVMKVPQHMCTPRQDDTETEKRLVVGRWQMPLTWLGLSMVAPWIDDDDDVDVDAVGKTIFIKVEKWQTFTQAVTSCHSNNFGKFSALLLQNVIMLCAHVICILPSIVEHTQPTNFDE